MLTAYVVLDGFDLGAGALHLFVARTDAERRAGAGRHRPVLGRQRSLAARDRRRAVRRLSACSPPACRASTSRFSWCSGRSCSAASRSSSAATSTAALAYGVGLSSRVASRLLPVLFGAALGNLLRGLPIDAHGASRCRCSPTSAPGLRSGILDWYTIAAGLFAGSLSRRTAPRSWRGRPTARSVSAAAAPPSLYVVVASLWPVATGLTWLVNPDMFRAIPGRPLAWASIAVAISGLACVAAGLRRRPLLAFLGSCAYLFGMLAATAACTFPGCCERSVTPPLADRLQCERTLVQPRNGHPMVGDRFSAGDPLLRGVVPTPPRQGGGRRRA